MDFSFDNLFTPAENGEPPAPLIAPTGKTEIDALANVVNSAAEPFQTAPDPEQGEIGKLNDKVNMYLGLMDLPSELLNTGFSMAASPLNKLVPGMPAAILSVPHLGLPHSHPHPPSMGVPMPSFGPTIGAGCMSVLIGGIPAIRVSDLGIAPTCGSFAPIFEIITGSGNTFIGGSRAARMGIDFTRECLPGMPMNKLREVGKIRKATNKAKQIGGVLMEGAGMGAEGLSVAAEAEKGNDEGAIVMAAQAAADAAIMALGALMGKDPGAPPCTGALLLGNPTVLIGGFPLPDSPALPRGGGGLPKLPKKKSPGKPNVHEPNHKDDRKGDPNNHEADKPCHAGHPVDPTTGASWNKFLDYEDRGPLAFRWERYYNSTWNEQNGPLGFGFRHNFQREISLLRTRAVYVDAQLREYEFPRDQQGRYGGIFAGFELEQIDDCRFMLKHEIQGDMTFERGSASGKTAWLVSLVTDRDRSDFRYAGDGRLERIVQVARDNDVFRSVTHFRYDALGHIIEMARTAADGSPLTIARYHYNDAGCLVEWRDPLGAIGSYAFDENRRMTQETDQNSFSFFYKYDGEGRCIASAGQDKIWRVKLRYEPGRTRVTEADGGEWIFYYNRAGTITRIVDPYGGARERVLDSLGRIVKDIDSGGRVMRWLYDERGRSTGRQDRWGNLWPTQDEAPNLPNPLAHEVPSTPLGLQWGESLPESAAEPLPYAISNLAVKVLSQPEPVLSEPRTIRDVAGRVVEEIDVYGRSETFRHDAAGNVVWRNDKDGREYHYTTVSWNLRGTESDPLGNTVEYGYTLREKVAFIADANGNESHYTYDYKDRITTVTRHGVLRESYKYDIGDRLIEKRDGKGNLLLKFEVGENGLHSKRILASGEVHHYEYDERGNFTKASTEKYDVRMSHDWAGRRTSDQRDGLGIIHTYRGMRLARTEYFGRFIATYETQADGDVLITTPVGGIHRLRRTADGRIEMQLGNGSQSLRRYDGDGRCTGRIHWQGGRTGAANWTRYAYSPEGELRRVADSRKETVEFRYDAAHRLVAEIRADSTSLEAGGWAVRHYEYDPAGNLLSMPTMPRMDYIEGNRLAASSSATFVYNHRNHLLEQHSLLGVCTRYHYDSMDMLVKVEWSEREEVWAAEYDGLCRRIAKTLGDRCTEYWWDGDRPAAELSPEGRLRLYVYPNEEAFLPFMFIDYAGVDAEPESGKAYFVFHNQVSLPEWIEDETGKTVWRAEDIDPYGWITVGEGNVIEYDLRFPGHYFDPETGLHYNRFRYYSPVFGRYLQSDPKGQSGGINLYAYPANPLVWADVLGLDGCQHADHSADNCPDSNGPKAEQLTLFGGPATPAPRQRPRLSREEGQLIVDRIHLIASDFSRRNNTTGLTELEDGRIAVTTNANKLSKAQRILAVRLLSEKGFEPGDMVFIDDPFIPLDDGQSIKNPYFIRALQGRTRTLGYDKTYDPPACHHAEQKGIRAGEIAGSNAYRQWTSSGEDPRNPYFPGRHGGAACSSCASIQEQYGIINETGVQPSKGKSPIDNWKGRYDKADTPLDIPNQLWNWNDFRKI
jgi:RHS repeat-associated protein